MRSTTLRRSRWALWLAFAALALRLFIAPGLMPVVKNGVVTIEMCTGQGVVKVERPALPHEQKPAKTDCAFATLGAAPLPVMPIALAQPMLFVAIAHSSLRPVQSPFVGVPAPPPPPTGPPALI